MDIININVYLKHPMGYGFLLLTSLNELLKHPMPVRKSLRVISMYLDGVRNTGQVRVLGLNKEKSFGELGGRPRVSSS